MNIFHTQMVVHPPDDILGGKPTKEAAAVAVKDILEVGGLQRTWVTDNGGGFCREYFRIQTSCGERMCFFEMFDRSDLPSPNVMLSTHGTESMRRDLIVAWGKALEAST